jgi:hypothetical protein
VRAELERAIGAYRSRTKWYVAAAAGGIAVLIATILLVVGSGNAPRSVHTQVVPGANADRGASSLAGSPIGDLGNTPVGDPANSLAAVQDRAEFNVEVPDTADANPQNVTALYADPNAVEMHFPSPDDQGLDPPYLRVIEENGDGNDPPITVEQGLAVLQQVSQETGHEEVLKLVTECRVGTLPAMCIAPADPEQKTDCTGTDPVVCVDLRSTAYVRFNDGNVAIQIDGGTSVQRLVEIGESMLLSDNAAETSGQG